MTDTAFSQDDFLGGRLSLKQPVKGYRVTSDSVFLAASINLNKGDNVLDVGAGSGGLLSLIAARLEGDIKNFTLHGIEIQQDLILLARENAFQGIEYYQGDILSDVKGCEPNSYHHVISNPPYYEKGKISSSPYKTKAVAHGDDLPDLKVWIDRCLRMVRPKGFLTLVHRADRLDDIITALNAKAGGVIIYPMRSIAEKDANRVIIRAQKDSNGLLALKFGMIVHKSDGNYTDAAENTLRHAHYLDIAK